MHLAKWGKQLGDVERKEVGPLTLGTARIFEREKALARMRSGAWNRPAICSTVTKPMRVDTFSGYESSGLSGYQHSLRASPAETRAGRSICGVSAK